MNDAPTDRLRETLRADGRVRLAVLFGSVAKGLAHPGSDLDLAVLLDERTTAGHELSLQEAVASVSGRDVDLVRLESANVILRNRIAREGVLLVERERGAFARFAANAALEYLEMEPLLIDARKRFLRRVASGA